MILYSEFHRIPHSRRPSDIENQTSDSLLANQKNPLTKRFRLYIIFELLKNNWSICLKIVVKILLCDKQLKLSIAIRSVLEKPLTIGCKGKIKTQKTSIYQ